MDPNENHLSTINNRNLFNFSYLSEDLLTVYWLLLWTSICCYGISILLFSERLPKFIINIYVYGKALDVGRKKSPEKRGYFSTQDKLANSKINRDIPIIFPIIKTHNRTKKIGRNGKVDKKLTLFWRMFLLPKRYFLHFYIAGIIFCLTSLLLVSIYFSKFYNDSINYVRTIIGESNSNLVVKWTPRLTSTRSNELATVNALLFALILVTIQVTRRAYECCFVSVYSDAKINFLHYMFGFMFYFGICLSTICPILLSDSNRRIDWPDILASILTVKHAIGFVIFVYASIIQHKCHVILANLRRDRSGRVISTQYYVPSGYMFELVTCPHFFAEVVLYIIISLVVASKEWSLIAILVTSNQILSAIIQHRWYQSSYEEYPIDRKAIIPFLL